MRSSPHCLRFTLALAVLAFSAGCGGGSAGVAEVVSAPRPYAPSPSGEPYDDTMTVDPVLSEYITASDGGRVEVWDEDSSLYGLVLEIPPGALPTSETISVGTVNNPPPLPPGLVYVGAPVDFGPDGLVMNQACVLEIPYTDADLSNAGLTDDVALTVHNYDEHTGRWEEVPVLSIDTSANVVRAQISHFSSQAITGPGAAASPDLGTPRPGDLVYKLSNGGWRPGHVGVYTGEKTYPGTGTATPAVVEHGKYNVVESQWDGGVQYGYFDFPNAEEAHEAQLEGFGRGDTYLGAREPRSGPLTDDQRARIVEYVEAQIGRPYPRNESTWGALFGMLAGSQVKGPERFNCVGLAERAYEEAGVNGGDGLTTEEQEEGGFPAAALTPAEHFSQTRPAMGENAAPTILDAALSPNTGDPTTVVLLQVTVHHPYGLDYIHSVQYVTDSGYTNPALYINDEGIDGDLIAGDGIYSVSASAGGDASWGSYGLTITVTDTLGKTDETALQFYYAKPGAPPAQTSVGASAKSSVRRLVEGSMR